MAGWWRRVFANAEAYERFMGRWSALLARALVDFARIPDDGFLLDVGSGSGSLTLAIASRGNRVRVQGIDLSKELVAFAEQRNPFPDRVRFEVGDAQQLRFDDGAFDGSLSLLAFNFIPDAARALRELQRVTKPGGWITAANWDYGAGMTMLRVFWDAAVSLDPAAEKLDENRMPLCRKGELSALWRECGLEQVQEQPLEISTRFESFADFWEPFLGGQGPAGAYAKSLDDAARAALAEDLRRRLRVPALGGAFELPARAWAVRGLVPL